MSEQEIQTLRRDLEREQRKLNLIMAMDRIRDSRQEPSAMLGAVVNLIAEEFNAGISLLVLIDRDTGELELKAVNDRGRSFGRLNPEALRELARRALKTDSVAVWEGVEVCEAFGLEDADVCRLHLAVVPIIMGVRVRLGALFIARLDQVFSADEIDLLQVAESQVDSTVIQGFDYVELDLRNRELETIYRVDRIRDENLGFDEMLNAVLEEIRGVIQAEMGYIMLYDHFADELELRAFSHDDLFKVSAYYDVIDAAAHEAMERAHLIFHNDLEGLLTSVMAIPLILRNEILGVFGVANAGGREFDERERRLLIAIASQMDTAIFESLEQRRLRRVLGRSVDPRVMERLLANPDVDLLKGDRQTLTVLYADIRGSTELAERTPPERLVEFINDYLGHMVEVILAEEGTLDKFVGDEVMALFGAPVPQEDHALRAVKVGLQMQAAHQRIVEDWQSRGVDVPRIGVGIATGELIVGEMGSPQRTDYTVIGRAANLGARICSHAAGGQVLISPATYDLVREVVEATPVMGVRMKGIGDDMTVYHVSAVKEG